MIFNKYKPTSLFGNRTLANGDSRFHNGIDFVGIKNAYVLSPVDGVVVSSVIITDKSNLTWEWGNYVCVESSDGYRHYFCHLDSRSVAKGQRVSKGHIIGVMGNTGYSFGAHTHYGIRDKFNKWVNPADYHNIKLVEGRIYVLEVKKLEHWAQGSLDNLINKKVIDNPEVWQDRFDEPVTKGQVLALLNKVIK